MLPLVVATHGSTTYLATRKFGRCIEVFRSRTYNGFQSGNKHGWFGAMIGFIDPQKGRHSSQVHGGQHLNLNAVLGERASNLSDRPDHTGKIARAKEVAFHAEEMNEVLVLIEKGHKERMQEEWITKATKEPLRLFPCSPDMEKVDDQFHAKDEELPLLELSLTCEQRSHFDPRY